MNQLIVGPYLANLLLLVGAAVGKLLHPQPFAAALARLGLPNRRSLARVAGLVELAAVALAVAVGPFPVLLADTAIAITAVCLARRAPDIGCGCFGAADGVPVGGAHIAVTAGMVVVSLVATVSGASLGTLIERGSVAAMTTAMLACAIAWLLSVVLRNNLQGARV